MKLKAEDEKVWTEFREAIKEKNLDMSALAKEYTHNYHSYGSYDSNEEELFFGDKSRKSLVIEEEELNLSNSLPGGSVSNQGEKIDIDKRGSYEDLKGESEGEVGNLIPDIGDDRIEDKINKSGILTSNIFSNEKKRKLEFANGKTSKMNRLLNFKNEEEEGFTSPRRRKEVKLDQHSSSKKGMIDENVILEQMKSRAPSTKKISFPFNIEIN